MPHNHSNSCSCCCTHYPDLLQKICPTRTWEADSVPAKRHFESAPPRRKRQSCRCNPNKKVRGKFGVAWICETPSCTCCEPFGWQVEFTDTPANVEQRCREMIEWVNNPPLPSGSERDQTCKCKKKDEQSPERCACCAEPRKQYHSSRGYRERHLNHFCTCDQFDEEEDDDEDCVCGGANGCSCCQRTCYCDELDEVPEKETPQATDGPKPAETLKTETLKPVLEPQSTTSATKLEEPPKVSPTKSEVRPAPSRNVAARAASRVAAHEPAPAREEGTARHRGAGKSEAIARICSNRDFQRGQEDVVIEHFKIGVGESCRRKKVKCDSDVRMEKERSRMEPVRRKMVECRCCSGARCGPMMRRKRRIWLPAEFTRAVLRNLKYYVDNTFGQSSQCNNAVSVVCANKITC